MTWEFWKILWTIVFFMSLALFAGMAVWVTLGGLKDIQNMLSKIKNNSDDST